MIKIGDLFNVEAMNHHTHKPEMVEAFVEEILFTPDFKLKQLGQQVSLYRRDGLDYIGDYFEKYLVPLNKTISSDDLKSLIREAVYRDCWGCVIDFVRVLSVMRARERDLKTPRDGP